MSPNACYPCLQSIQSLAVVTAIGVNELGEREALGFALGGSETEAFWLEFLRSLV